MTNKLFDSSLRAKVVDAYKFSVAQGGTFNRASAKGYLTLYGFTYDSKQLSQYVKEVAEENNVTRSRVTYKQKLIDSIGVEIFNSDDLLKYLAADYPETAEDEAKKYIRYVELAERLIAKYEGK